jgi:hypothetical protein
MTFTAVLVGLGRAVAALGVSRQQADARATAATTNDNHRTRQVVLTVSIVIEGRDNRLDWIERSCRLRLRQLGVGRGLRP